MKAKSKKKSTAKVEDKETVTAVTTSTPKVTKAKTVKEKTVRGQGRPTIPTSARQLRLAAMAKRAAANGGVVKRGRDINKKSARQIRLTKAASDAAKGIVAKRGRPAAKKVVAVTKAKRKPEAVKSKVEVTPVTASIEA